MLVFPLPENWAQDSGRSVFHRGKDKRLDLLCMTEVSSLPQMCSKDGKGSSVITPEACRRTDLMFIKFIFMKP